MTERLTNEQMLTRAARAVGKVDRYGARGVTCVSFDEIESMAATLAALGVPALPPDAETEDPAFVLILDFADGLRALQPLPKPPFNRR